MMEFKFKSESESTPTDMSRRLAHTIPVTVHYRLTKYDASSDILCERIEEKGIITTIKKSLIKTKAELVDVLQFLTGSRSDAALVLQYILPGFGEAYEMNAMDEWAE